MYLTFFSYPRTAKLLVTAYQNDSKPEIESLHFIQVVTVWHTKQPQNIEVAASKVRKKIVSLCMTTKKPQKNSICTCQYKLYKKLKLQVWEVVQEHQDQTAGRILQLPFLIFHFSPIFHLLVSGCFFVFNQKNQLCALVR